MRHPLETVVVGVDGSALSAAALGWVADRVPPQGTIHVVHARRPSSELTAAAFQVEAVALRQQAEADLAGPWTEVARSAGRAPITHLVDDEPARALLQVAADGFAAAIVIGVHGGGRARLPSIGTIGGVTRRILHRSAIPVIVIDEATPATPATPATASRPPHVIAGVGYGEASDRATRWAADYAAARHLPLQLVHAVANRPLFPVDSPVDTLGSYLGPGVNVDWAIEDLALIREHVAERHPGLAVSERVELGSAAELLASAATGAEILVAGKRHSDRLARMTISPRLRHLVAHAPCPMVIVPSHPPAPGPPEPGDPRTARSADPGP